MNFSVHSAGTIDLSKSFINSEEITFYLSRGILKIDLSQWKKVKILSLGSRTHVFPKEPLSNHLPSTVCRSNLKGSFIQTIFWERYIHHLTELRLSNNFYLTSLKGMSLDTNPVIHLSHFRQLTSLEGLGAKNKKVTVIDCDKIADFSILRTIDTVSISFCEGFRDLRQVQQVRVLEVKTAASLLEERPLEHLNCLGERMEVLFITAKCFKSSDYQLVSEIPHLGLEDPNLDAMYFFLVDGGRFHNQTFSVFSCSKTWHIILDDIYFPYLSSNYRWFYQKLRWVGELESEGLKFIKRN